MNVKIMILMMFTAFSLFQGNLYAEDSESKYTLIGKMNTQKAPLATKKISGIAINKNEVQITAPASYWKGHWNAGQFALPQNGKIVLKAEYKNASARFVLQLYGGKTMPAPSTIEAKDGKLKAVWNISSGKSGALSALWLTMKRTGADTAKVKINELSVWREKISTRLDADQILKTPPKHTAELLPHNGAMTLFLDGKPITGQMWAGMCYNNIRDKYLKEVLNGLDYPMVAIPFAVGECWTKLYPSSWTGTDEFDWSYIDRHARRVLKARPDAKLILMLALDGAKWWNKTNPESANFEIDKLMASFGKPGPYGVPDYLSEKWKKASRDLLRQLVAHVQSSDWGDSVIGYELFNGVTMDCNFSIPHKNARVASDFRESLKKRYKTNANLQRAWHKPSAKLKTAQTQTKVPEGIVLEPAKHQQFLDTRRLLVGQFREVFSNFAAIIKEATHGKALVGARTGDFFGNFGWNGNGVKLGDDSGWLLPLLKDPNFDYFDVQEPYPGRMLGYGAGVPVLPAQALYQYKKTVFIQNDIRTHLSKTTAGYGRTPNLPTTIEIQRRVFVNALTYNMIPYLWQMAWSYNQPKLLAEYRLQEKILSEALNKDRSSVAEVAIVFDPEMRLYLGRDTKYSAPSRYFALFDFTKHVWQRGGAPFDMIFIDQIKELPPYRVYVFCNTWRFSKKQRQMIREKVFKNGQTAVFLWSDGVINQDGRFGNQELSKLSGMNIQMLKKAQTWQMSATQSFAKLAGIKSGSEVGVLKKQNYDPCGANASKWEYSPAFEIKAGNKTIALARRKNNQISAAMRRYDNYTTIYSASGNLVEPLLRLAIKSSKAFEYTKSNALLMMNKSYIAFHTYKAEIIKLKLPQREALRDLFNGKLYPAAKAHDIRVEKNKTYLFERITNFNE